MDSLSQLALGATVGVATLGRRTAPWKAALVGAVCGTLPDLDVFIDYGDPVRNMTLHRAESHSLFYLTLLSPALAWLAARLFRESQHFRRWWLAVWLALITHPLLDLMTVYGTQLTQPFSDHPWAVGSIFIIDPFYTLPLLIGCITTLCLRSPQRWRWNALGLALSTAYLAWGMLAQHIVQQHARTALQAQGITSERILITPTPFNSLLWRILVMDSQGNYHEGFRALLDRGAHIHFDRFPQQRALATKLPENPSLQRIQWFSQGFWRLREADGQLIISDLRMGQEPNYSFNFVLAEQRGEDYIAITPRATRQFADFQRGMTWIWRRARGEALPPPR